MLDRMADVTRYTAMTRIRESIEVLNSVDDERQQQNQERRTIRATDRFAEEEEPEILLGTTGISVLLALEATLPKKEPDKRKDKPMRGYSQKICVHVRSFGAVESRIRYMSAG